MPNDDNSTNLQYNKDDVIERIDLNNLAQINDTEHEHNFRS